MEGENEELTKEEKLNEMRKQVRTTDLIWKSVSAVSVLLVFVYIGILIYNKAFFEFAVWKVIVSIVLLILIFGSLYLLPVFLKMGSKKKEYSHAYKNVYLKPALEQAFGEGSYNEEEKISVKELTEVSLLKKARTAVANDCVRGKYKGISFLRYDMTLRFEKKSATADCVMIVSDLKTKAKTDVQIIRNKFKIGGQEYIQPEGFIKLTSGKESFDKKYTIYAKDSEKGDDFIKKTLIKNIADLSFDGPIAAFFEKNKVYLIIKTGKDAMEAPIYSEVKESKCRKETERQIEIIKEWMSVLEDCVER